MKNALLMVILTYTMASNANDFGMIEGFSIKQVQLYNSPSGEKLKKIPRESISTPIKIDEIGPKNKYYKITLEEESFWVKKRTVLSNNIKINCLSLTSNMNKHVAGSKALSSEECN